MTEDEIIKPCRSCLMPREYGSGEVCLACFWGGGGETWPYFKQDPEKEARE